MMDEASADSEVDQGPFEPIAIIGMGCIMPDAPDVGAFWKNVQDARVSFRDVPNDRWDPADFYSEEKQENMTYSKIGAFVEGYEFDWRRWRLPPGTLPQIDVCQQWAVSVSAAALEDAGYLGEGAKEPPRAQTAVIFANALGGENRNLSNQRVWAKRTVRLAEQHGLSDADRFLADITEGTPRIDEDTMPGELANVVAGRVANLLDLQGPNYSTDAACASSMAAVLDACRQLQLRQVEMAIAGASDRTMDPATYAKFSAIGALSATHSRPFDSSADGFVMGEGAGAFVLKRLVDAVEDEDRVYAVIRGIGASSDGRGKGITAPSQRGQQQAVERAYAQAGYPVDSVTLIEAHGTSTRVGDATELSSLGHVFRGGASTDRTAVGSIKSQIGHLKAAAGIAGMLKVALALHHQVIPPSAGFENPNETLDWDSLPFYVPTASESWSQQEDPRRAGVSAFGFGGTNFHVAMEEYDRTIHAPLAERWSQRWAAYSSDVPPHPVEANTTAISASEPEPTMSWEQLKAIEGGVLLLNAADSAGLRERIEAARKQLFDGQPTFDASPDGVRLSERMRRVSERFVCEGLRCALIALDWAQLEQRLDLALDSLDDQSRWGFLASQDVFISDQPSLSEAKTAHMYPGQGSQYVGMSLDLARRYGIVQQTWDEADEIMIDILDGKALSAFVLLDDMNGEQRAAAEALLMQTEHTQPAMLTADLALDRLLAEHGQTADMVAGHSLGEYAALMASGMLEFRDALRAAAARGTEMGSVEVRDNGLMASVSAPYEKVEEILDRVDGYVIAANRNSPRMTVIAGDTAAIKDAITRFDEAGVGCVILATSHAFHTRIVAPANAPLERFLKGLAIRLPSLPITSNYDGQFYPMRCEEGFSTHETILPQLAPQMSSPVEWITQIENMHEEGARIFIEVGPKRALTTFCDQILENEPHLAVMTNHPKLGGIRSFLCSLGRLALAGRPIRIPSLDDPVHSEAFRAGPLEATRAAPSVATDSMPLAASPADSAKLTAVQEAASPEPAQVPTLKATEEWVGGVCAEVSGYPAIVCRGSVDLRSGLGLDEGQVGALMARIEAEASGEGDLPSLRTIDDIVGWITAPPRTPASSPAGEYRESRDAGAAIVTSLAAESSRQQDPYVVTGISLGLPGMEQVFEPDALERILSGENFITELPDELKERLLDKNLVRILKHPDGNVELVRCQDYEMIPQLAGRGGYFDLGEQYGVDAKIVASMDVATTLAFAAGLEALRDAGLPLFPIEQVSSAGKRLIKGWNLPPSMRDGTGVIFASVFPGINMAMRHAANNGADEDGTFDRRFLLQVLTMGHSQFAQWIGARGPNAAINNACASTPAAFAIAEDWITTGRCERVIVISGDDPTSDELMEWIGAGFAAAGAHALGNVASEVSLPFDARRNGMLLGMGAAAFVIERSSHAEQRGVVPYAELLGAHIGNSAFHPTRLDVGHVSDSLDDFITRMEAEWGLDRSEIASRTTFMSHEPATPPRGGSAAAEISALRRAFGHAASSLIITNTKGFTGHPMGAGIEDATVLYGLAAGRLPPIANFEQPDPELGDLRLSQGGVYDVEYALRHAAGFGSQIAFTFFRRLARGLNRFRPGSIAAWAGSQAGGEVELRLLFRKLVVWVDGDENLIGGIRGEQWDEGVFDAEPSAPTPPAPAPAPAPVLEAEPEAEPAEDSAEAPEVSIPPVDPVPAPLEPETPAAPAGNQSIVEQVIATVVEHTGYPADFIELDQDLEGDLGVDSVKQAEIMADMRSHFELPADEEFVLSEHPTLNHMIAYISGMLGSEPIPSPAPLNLQPAEHGETITAKVLEVVIEHTGYPTDFIGFDQDLEGELGVDSVKQAEMMADLRAHFDLVQDDSFVLSEHPTLDHIIAYIKSMQPASPSAEEREQISVDPSGEHAAEAIAPAELFSEIPSEEEESVEELSEQDSVTTAFEGVRRWQVEVEELADLSGGEVDLGGRTVLISDENWGLSERLIDQLEARGIDSLRLSLDPSCRSFSVEQRGEGTILRAHPASEQHIEQVVAHLKSAGPLGGIIHLAPLDLTGLPWTVQNSTSQSAVASTSLFMLLQRLDAELSESAGIVASVSALDGRHGNRGSHFNSVAAGAHGVVKAYAKEQPHLACTALDVHPELLSQPGELAEHIASEILSTDPVTEVGLDRDGRRWRMVLFEEDLVAERASLTAEDVLLVSGGGSGVTATSIIALSAACRGSGATFVMLGRTELIPQTADWLDWDDEHLEQRKLALREELLTRQEQVSIVDWERAWQPYARSLDINAVIEAIESCGNAAFYHHCDVLDAESLAAIGRQVGERHGPVSIIVHGAGIEDSKLVADKQVATFERVVSIKANGLVNLMDAAAASGAEHPRLVCCFTSIAGRFGNGGQTDYSAANNVLDAEMARLTATGDTRGLAIAWTGWRDVGMATRGSVERVFEQAGIETVSVEQGVSLFVDEVLRGGKRRVVVAGALGILDEDGVKREAPLLLPPDVATLLAAVGHMPLVSRLCAYHPEQDLIVETTLDVERFPFLADHAIEGVPYLPGVMALEAFAQCARLLIPDSAVSGFDDVIFALPVKLIGAEKTVRIRAELLTRNSVRCTMESDLANSTGVVFGEPSLHHQATVRLTEDEGGQPLFAEMGTPRRGDVEISPEFIYQRFFHGPAFQCHGGVIRGIAEGRQLGADGVVLQRGQLPARVQFQLEAMGVEVMLESLPMLHEAAFQNAGLVMMETTGMQALPVGIASSRIGRRPGPNEKLLVRTVCRSSDGETSVHDALIVPEAMRDEVLMVIKGIELKALGPLPEDQRFEMQR